MTGSGNPKTPSSTPHNKLHWTGNGYTINLVSGPGSSRIITHEFQIMIPFPGAVLPGFWKQLQEVMNLR